MLRVTASAIALLLGVAACAGPTTIESNPVGTHPVSKHVALANVDVEPETISADTRPRYEGFGSLDGPETALVALVKGDTQIYAAAGDVTSEMTMPWTTILGTVTVLAVVDQPTDGWAEVMLPIRPNGSTGFIRTNEVKLYAVAGKITVDLSEKQLIYTVDNDEILTTDIAIGSPKNPTPTGSFFVTDSVTLSNPGSPWGPHALGLSARSDTITEYNGGDGIIGIHGTSNPSSIGQAASLGCVRLPNEVITLLHAMVPIGTPVEIRA